MADSDRQNEIIDLVPIGDRGTDLVQAGIDIEPNFDGVYLDQYREIVDRFDRVFRAFPEHQKASLWILSRKVAEDYVSGLMPDVRADQHRDRRLGVMLKEIGVFVRTADQVALQKTELSILFIGILAEIVTDKVEDDRLRKEILNDVRRAFLQLLR